MIPVGPVIARQEVAASRETVWQALINADLRSEWFAELEFAPERGSQVTCKDLAGFVDVCVRGHVLGFKWAAAGDLSTNVMLTLRTLNTGTLVTVTEFGFDGLQDAAVAAEKATASWNAALARFNELDFSAVVVPAADLQAEADLAANAALSDQQVASEEVVTGDTSLTTDVSDEADVTAAEETEAAVLEVDDAELAAEDAELATEAAEPVEKAEPAAEMVTLPEAAVPAENAAAETHITAEAAKTAADETEKDALEEDAELASEQPADEQAADEQLADAQSEPDFDALILPEIPAEVQAAAQAAAESESTAEPRAEDPEAELAKAETAASENAGDNTDATEDPFAALFGEAQAPAAQSADAAAQNSSSQAHANNRELPKRKWWKI